MHNKTLLSILGATALLLGCPAEEDPPGSTNGEATTDDDDSSDSEEETETAAVTDTEGQTTMPGTTMPGTTTETPDTDTPSDTETPSETEGDTEDPNPPGEIFLIPSDGGGPTIECSVWDQDCDEGQKCAAWANDGGNSWNATKCVPIDPADHQPGDACTVEGSGVSGIDTCAESSMCWNVDGKTNMGTCVAFCSGSEAAPVCDNPSTSCSIANEGVLILCLPTCDPNLQDCTDGEACYGIDDAYVCAPDASGEMGAYPDPCEFINACDPGLECLGAAATPGCTSGSCCTPFCDTSDPDAGIACPGAGGGQECVAAFEEGNAPPGYEDVGYCAIPA